MGRARYELSSDFNKVADKYRNKEITNSEVAKLLNE